MNAKKATISSVALNNNFIWVVWYGSVFTGWFGKTFLRRLYPTAAPQFFGQKLIFKAYHIM